MTAEREMLATRAVISMPDLSTVLLFGLACLALTATPGPDMLLIASRSVSQGRVAGFATLAGIQAGTYGHALAAAFGLSHLFLALPLAYDAVRYVGAAYLLYLAWQTVRSGAAKGGIAEPASPRVHSAWRMARQGFWTNLANPKMILFVLALFPQFVKPESGSVVVQILVLATILNLVGLVVNGAVIVAVSSIGTRCAARGRLRRASEYLLGAVFAGLALRLVLDDRR